MCVGSACSIETHMNDRLHMAISVEYAVRVRERWHCIEATVRMLNVFCN